MSVVINKEVSQGLYKATATLDNGNDVKITVLFYIVEHIIQFSKTLILL